jgi:phosphoglycerate kinase
MHLCDIKNKIALVRVNYDLPNISEKSRILDSKKTIDQLLSKNNKVVLVSHWGRPSSFESELSMERLKDILVEVFNEEVLYINQYEYFNQKTNDLRVLIENSREKIILLENTRFVKSEKGGVTYRMGLAKKYSQIADVFVDEAFAVSHRKEATNYEIKELMKTCYGLSYLNEKTNLNEFKLSKKHPKYVIM